MCSFFIYCFNVDIPFKFFVELKMFIGGVCVGVGKKKVTSVKKRKKKFFFFNDGNKFSEKRCVRKIPNENYSKNFGQ